jgi:hypothetical protein
VSVNRGKIEVETCLLLLSGEPFPQHHKRNYTAPHTTPNRHNTDWVQQSMMYCRRVRLRLAFPVTPTFYRAHRKFIPLRYQSTDQHHLALATIKSVPSVSVSLQGGNSPATSYLGERRSVSTGIEPIPPSYQREGSPPSATPTATRGDGDVFDITRRLLTPNDDGNITVQRFSESLIDARTNKSYLQSLELSSHEAKSMLILPPELLKDVHLAITHFSKRENFGGMALPGAKLPFVKHKQKVLGPIICTKLLELIGVPHYYSQLSQFPSSSQYSSTASPTIVVHSSQIDQILHCCLQTSVALSHSCNTGRNSLIGYDFSSHAPTASTAGNKTSAHLVEDIWRCVWNMQIKYTSGKKSGENDRYQQHPAPISQNVRIGRVGSVGVKYNAVIEYLQDHQKDADKRRTTIPWDKKDRRRYDQSVAIFNSVLASYAKLGSSATGARAEVRRGMAQNAERLLLEVAAKKKADVLSPSTTLQCMQPDVISFNTAMKAWSELSPRQRNFEHNDFSGSSLVTLTAERTEAILDMMQELWDEDRSTRSTQESVQIAWDEHEDGGLHQLKAVAPNTSSYNTVLNAWSRSSDRDAASKAMAVFLKMLDRCNISFVGRELLMLNNSPNGKWDEGFGALPDSRTFVALLGCCHNRSLSMNFEDSLDLIETIFAYMKQYDKQMQWSRDKGLLRGGVEPVLNEFTCNALVKALSALPKTSWDESHQSCLRIDEIIAEGMERDKGTSKPPGITRGLAIHAWRSCADWTRGDREQLKVSAKKAGAHVDILLSELEGRTKGTESSSILHAVNNVIALYGEAAMPDEAEALFLRAKECNVHNFESLSAVIDALTVNSSQGISYAINAQQYLLEFEQSRTSSLLGPDMKYTRLYNAVISGLVNSDSLYDGCNLAQSLLSRMIWSHETNPKHIARPNTTSFVTVMAALANGGDHTDTIESLLSKMESMRDQRKQSLRDVLEANVMPNIVAYNILLKSYARSQKDEAIASALKLFGRMESDSATPSPDDVSQSLMAGILSGKVQSANNGEESSTNSTNFLVDDITLDNLSVVCQNLEPTAKAFSPIMKSEYCSAFLRC